jgi:hypothetical protein
MKSLNPYAPSRAPSPPRPKFGRREMAIVGCLLLATAISGVAGWRFRKQLSTQIPDSVAVYISRMLESVPMPPMPERRSAPDAVPRLAIPVRGLTSQVEALGR